MRKSDDLVGEIREIRHGISEEFGHDPKRYIQYLENLRYDYSKQTRLYEELSDKRFDRTAMSGL
uniref:Uncharacterized protein n=1 Tax=Candidatus Kentrum sp. LFY TaxID=2126342 RepID=A0A450WUL2_9GAMM|nr:MAG: hypothetical protein BECKLFY1418C_GA0070996_107716 [Candidatus Kentron sp. LFY]